MATEAQIAANRRNSRLSTGPRSIDGKNRSRGNSLKHGLCASTIVVETAEMVQERAWHIYEGLKPQNKYQAWLCDQVAVFSLRSDRCQRLERRARDKVALRACAAWDDDKNLEAKALGKRLASSPEEVVDLLRKTPHGCDWLVDRWAQLAHAARVAEGGSWSEEQARLAFDLLAIPHAFRPGREPGVVLDCYGEILEAAPGPVEVARRQVDELLAHREVVAELDEAERALAEADLSDGKDPEVRRHRRYESSIHRHIRWCVEQVKGSTPHAHRASHLTPNWVPIELPSEAKPEPEPKPERPTVEEVLLEEWDPEKINPPFDLAPHEYPEPGQVADIPQIVRDRKQKGLARAEARREARRRKLEKLRA